MPAGNDVSGAYSFATYSRIFGKQSHPLQLDDLIIKKLFHNLGSL
jgi:hypothetical protein